MRDRREERVRDVKIDWIIDMGGIEVLVEKIDQAVRDRIVDRFRMFRNGLEDLIRHPLDKKGYRIINGYRVREIFAGEESLTSLLTQYMERTVALHY